MAIVEKKWLTVSEAALYLGLKKSTIYKKICKKVIKRYRPDGGRVYFNIADLDAYIQRGGNREI